MTSYLEDVGKYDLEAPDDHDPGGACQGNGPVQEVDADQPDDCLASGVNILQRNC